MSVSMLGTPLFHANEVPEEPESELIALFGTSSEFLQRVYEAVEPHRSVRVFRSAAAASSWLRGAQPQLLLLEAGAALELPPDPHLSVLELRHPTPVEVLREQVEAALLQATERRLERAMLLRRHGLPERPHGLSARLPELDLQVRRSPVMDLRTGAVVAEVGRPLVPAGFGSMAQLWALARWAELDQTLARRLLEGVEHSSLPLLLPGEGLASTLLSATQGRLSRPLTLELDRSHVHLAPELHEMGVATSCCVGSDPQDLDLARRLQPSLLRLEEGLVASLAVSAASRGVVRDLVSWAAHHDLQLVATGVRGSEPLARLRRLGVRFASGSLHIGGPPT